MVPLISDDGEIGTNISEETQTVASFEEPERSEYTGKNDLTGINNWLYMLDVDMNPELIQKVADSSYDVIVIDFIPSEAGNEHFPIEDVVLQWHSAANPKLVLAYIDIGQAEDYRTYWMPHWRIGDPVWIVAEDPDGWEGNYPVAFWNEEWKKIWIGEGGYLQWILNKGFDGIYMDWIEAYMDENVEDAALSDAIEPQDEMLRWIIEISEYSRATKPDFILVGQNGYELLTSDDLVGYIDAIAQEHVWFDGGEDNEPPGDCPLPARRSDVLLISYRNSLSDECRIFFDEEAQGTLHSSSDEYIEGLRIAKEKGLVVLTVDYALQPENIERVTRISRQMGFIPFVSSRALDRYIEPLP